MDVLIALRLTPNCAVILAQSLTNKLRSAGDWGIPDFIPGSYIRQLMENVRRFSCLARSGTNAPTVP
jgi:hypothetical protein